jgi:hypothetical protein
MLKGDWCGWRSGGSDTGPGDRLKTFVEHHSKQAQRRFARLLAAALPVRNQIPAYIEVAREYGLGNTLTMADRTDFFRREVIDFREAGFNEFAHRLHVNRATSCNASVVSWIAA